MSQRLFIARLTLLMMLTLSITNWANAQLTGIKTIPGDYATITLAVADLNTNGVGAGGVTFNVAAGYTETISSTISLTATGTSSNKIVFQKSGAGANPLITAYTTGSATPTSTTQDGIWRLIGSDYVTINGIDLNDPNATNNATMEYGYALYKNSVTDGCQYDTIKNCTITLNRVNNATGTAPMVDGSSGIIVMNATYSAATTNLTPTSSSGTNSYNAFYTNTIQNCNTGIGIIGYAAASPFTLADQGNDVGGTSLATGNQILNFGGGGTNAAVGVRTLAQYGLNVSYNTINSNNGVGVNHTGILRGIYINTATSASSNINYNTITVKSAATTSQLSAIENVSGSTAASNTVNINYNNITNCAHTAATSGVWYGIYSNGATPANLSISNNTFTGNSTIATSGSYYNIYNTGAVATSITLSNNTIDVGTHSAASTSATVYNIYTATSGNASCTYTANSNTFQNASYTGATGGTGNFACIYNAVQWASTTMNSNNFNNLSIKTTSGSYYLMYNSNSTANTTTNSNVITTAFNKTAAGGTFYCYYNFGSPSGGTATFTSNNFSNITLTGATAFYGIYQATSTSQVEVITSNTISNITSGASTLIGIHHNYGAANSLVNGNTVSGIAGAAQVTGIQIGNSTASSGLDVYDNKVYTLSTTGSSPVYGIYHYSGNATNIYRNKIYDLSANASGSTIYGIYFASTPNTVNAYNNIIGDLRNTIATITAPAPAIAGIYASTGTTLNIHYNTVYLNATSSGANFGTAAMYTSTTPTVTLRDNIFVNNSTPNGTGRAIAYQRSSTTLTSYSTSSNNNLFYTPGGANQVIYYDGTTAQSTLAAFKTAMATRDQLSVTENPTWASTVDANTNYLHINTAVATQIEGAGTPIAGVTTDFDSETRSSTTPDIGADEFTGISGAMTINSVSATAVSCVGSSHVVTANITAGVGALTTITLNYSFNGTAQTPITMTGGTVTGTSNWTATIPIGVPVNAVVTYTVVATDGTYTRQLAGTSYQDAPLTGIVATATASVSPVCSGSPTALSVAVPVTSTLGTAGTTQSGSGLSPYAQTWEGLHVQYLVRASELTAAGIGAGNFTSIAFNVTVASTTLPFSNYTIKMGNTATTDLASSFATATLTSVYGPSTVAFPTTGYNTYTFTTPFAWDGTSNVVIDVCFENDPTGLGTYWTSNSTVAATTIAGYTPVRGYYADNSYMCGLTNGTLVTSTARPDMRFNVNGSPATLNLTTSWSDGATTIGTGTPLNISPTTTKTYTATLTNANSCSINSNGVTVTVNPLPTAPTATNSTQCGQGVPTASVAGTGTPVWYNVPSGGTALQVGGNTYTTAINTTTTFYVALSNGTCESVRTPVTVTVNQPDVVTATGSSPICLTAQESLNAIKNPGPNTYTYTWSANPAAGSGMPSPLTGAAQTVTPTVAGTYTYTVTAVDATLGCTTNSTKVVTVNPLPTIASATATPTTVCSGATTALAAYKILGASATIGTGTVQNTSTTYPAPYGQYYTGARTQMLVLASELSAAGMTAGPINSLAFSVANTNGSAAMTNFTINMTNTALTALTSAFVTTGLTQVYTSASYAPVTGTNTHTFTTQFDWDGTSNVLVDVYFSNCLSCAVPPSQTCNTTNYTNNCTMNQTATAFTSTSWYYSDGTSCQIQLQTTANATPVNQRPNMVFGRTATGTPYNWTWTPGNLAGNTTNATTSNPGTTPIAVTYTVTAVDPATNCFSTATTSPVTVNPLPTAAITGAVSICSGQSASIFFTGTPNATVAYTKNAVAQTAITLDATGSYTLNTGALVANTTYALTSATNPTTTCSQSVAGSVLVTIKPNPTAVASSNSSICSGQTLNLTGTTDIGTTFQWAGPSFASLAQNPSIANAQTSASGTYTFTATANGCSTSGTTVVLVKPNPIAGAGNNGPVCAGQDINLTGVTDIGTSFAWAGPSYASIQQNPTINNAQAVNAGTYTFTATASGCSTSATTTVTVKPQPTAGASNNGPICAGNTLNLSGTTDIGTSFQWSGPSFTSISQNPSIINAQPAASGTYTFTATLNGCSQAATTFVAVNPNPVLTPGSNSPVCEGNTVHLLGNNDIGTLFDWSGPNGFSSSLQDDDILNATLAATGTYTFTATSGLGCASTGTIYVDIKPLPTAVPTSNSPICDGQTLNLVGATDYGVTFNWDGPGAYNSGAQNPNIVGATTAAGGTYTFTATTADGCSTTNTTDVEVNPLPTVTASSNSPVCAGQTLNLTGTTDIGTGFTWNGPNGFSSALQNDNIANVTVPASGTYTYTATSAVGCSNSTTTDVTIMPRPTVSLSGSAAICNAGTTNLAANFTGTGPWGFTYTDGVSPVNANSASASYTFPVSPAGTATYTITALSDANCTALPGDINGTPTVTVNPNGGWTGTLSTDWQTAGNWCGGIPTATTDVIIPGTAINMPLLNTGTGYAHDLNISNGASVTVASGGTLEMHGNVISFGAFDPTTGALVFNGTGAQNAPGFTTNDLTMNGLSLGTLGNVHVQNSLTMLSGYIDVGNNTLELGKSTAQTGTLNYTSGRVYGNMKRWFNGTNAGQSGLFPFGFNGNNRFITVEYTQAPANGGSLTGHYFANTIGIHTINNNNTLTITNPLPCAGTFDVTRIDTNIWKLIPADGFSNTGNPVNDGLYNVTIQAENLNNYSNVCELTALKSDDDINWLPDGVHVASTLSASTVTSKRTGASGWSSWTYAGSDANPLLVKLLEFTGKVVDKNVSRLDWHVSNMEGNEQFELQRSLDGKTFEQIGNLPAERNKPYYNLYDRNMAKSLNYYRLKITDVSGNYVYSKVLPLLNTDVEAEIIYLAPSVTTGKTTAYIQSNISGKVAIKVFDMIGKNIYDMNFNLEKGANHVDFDFGGLASGTYTMHIVLDSGISSPVRFIKQ